LDVKVRNFGIAFLAACLIVAYLWPFHAHPFGGFMSDWLAILGIGIIFALQIRGPYTTLRLPWIMAVPASLALVIALQTAAGMLWVPWDAVFPIAYLCMAGLAMLIGSSLSVTEEGRARLCAAVVSAHLLAALISVVIATIQYFHGEAAFGVLIIQMSRGLNGPLRPFANIAQPNQLALLFCIGIASVWWLYQNRRLPTAALIGLTLSLFWGMAITQSRIVWMITPAFAGLVLYWQCRGNFKVVPPWLVACFLLFYGALVLALPAISAFFGIVTDSVAQHVGNSSVRLALIRQAWQISLSHPLFGVGWYQFGPQQLMLGAQLAVNLYAEHSHNIVMNFASELGWPITIVIFSVLAYWFYETCIRKHLSSDVGFSALFFVAAFIHSLVEYPLWYAYVLMPLALLMGMVHQQRFSASEMRVSRLQIGSVVVVIVLCLVGSALDFRRLHLGFRALGFELMKLGSMEGSTAKPRLTLFPHYYDYFKFAKTPEYEGMPVEEIAFMERVALRFGYDQVMMRMASIYALNDRPEDALRVMLALHEFHRDAYKNSYFAWQYFAATRPDKYAAIFSRLPLPSSSLK
jgi:hypothetical protein